MEDPGAIKNVRAHSFAKEALLSFDSLSPGFKSDILHGKTGHVAATSRFNAYLSQSYSVIISYTG